MSKVRINDLARELEVKSRCILDPLTAVGVIEAKTHSSSIEADEAEKVRGYIKGRRASTPSARPAPETKPAFDLAHVAKPGDAMRLILERKAAEAEARSHPPRPTAVAAPKPAVAAAAPAVKATTAPASSPGGAPPPAPP